MELTGEILFSQTQLESQATLEHRKLADCPASGLKSQVSRDGVFFADSFPRLAYIRNTPMAVERLVYTLGFRLTIWRTPHRHTWCVRIQIQSLNNCKIHFKE